MSMSHAITRTVCAAVLSAGVAAGPAAQGPPPEELARRLYEMGLESMKGGKYSEALKDLQSVVDSYGSSSVAGDALVQIATYHLEIARDVTAAQSTTATLLKKYSSTPAALMGYVLEGRIAIEMGREPADVDSALMSFGHVEKLNPASDVVPVASYYAGESLRSVHDCDRALEKYRDVTERYPTSVWAARALLGMSQCLVQAGRVIPATSALQRVRAQFPGSPEAATALKWNTILYRLYIRYPAQPAYAFAGKVLGGATARFKDVVAVVLDRSDDVFLAHQTAVSIFDPKGALVRSIGADSPSAFALDRQGAAMIIHGNGVQAEAAKPILFTIPQPGSNPKNVEITAAVMTSRGEWLIADRKDKVIDLFSAAGKYVRPFASRAADRVALDAAGALASLDRDGKIVTIVDRDNKPIGRIGSRGKEYALENPVDVAFDTLGHVYVLDRDAPAVFVFTPGGRWIATFSIPEKNPGAFPKAVAFGLDSAARLFIFDDRAQRVQIYQ